MQTDAAPLFFSYALLHGTPVAGTPNNRLALQTLTEETFGIKMRQGKPPSRMYLGAVAIPLGTTNGTTNAVVFGMELMDQRDEQLNWILVPPKSFTHHDMDTAPRWYFYKRPSMYIDGFAEKRNRGLMQFTLVPENGPDFYRKYEENFRDVLAYINSLRPPEYSGVVDQSLAENGELLFNANCAEYTHYAPQSGASSHRDCDGPPQSRRNWPARLRMSAISCGFSRIFVTLLIGNFIR